MRIRAMHRRACILVTAAMLAVAAPALAEEPDPSQKAKEAFSLGREAVKRGDCAAALPHFAQSQQLSPTAGALFNMAQCEEQLGKLASALGHFSELAPMLAANDPRLAIATERAGLLEARVPILQIAMATGTPKDTSVTLDGTLLTESRLSGEIRVDPGEHALTVTAPGREVQRYEVVTVEERPLQIIRLVVAPGAEIAPVEPMNALRRRAEPRREAPPRLPAAAAPGKSPMRAVGFVIGGIGIVGAGLGSVAGALAIDRNSELEAMCPAMCPGERAARGRALEDETRDFADASTVGFSIGLSGLALGAALVLSSDTTSKRAVRLEATVLPGGGGVAARGRF